MMDNEKFKEEILKKQLRHSVDSMTAAGDYEGLQISTYFAFCYLSQLHQLCFDELTRQEYAQAALSDEEV